MTTGAQLALDLACDEGIGSVERALVARGDRWAVGVDEAGRGPLAGPVTVAAVLLDLSDLSWVAGLDDSKKLAAADRDALFERVVSRTAYAVVQVERDEIDTLNILWASLEGMRRAVEQLRGEAPAAAGVEVLVDGNRAVPRLAGRQRCLVRGDGRSLAIAAASIVAKVTRDREMERLAAEHPEYGFERHKGYPTAQHLAALQRHGPCPAHRQTFAPVAAVLNRPAGEAE